VVHYLPTIRFFLVRVLAPVGQFLPGGSPAGRQAPDPLGPVSCMKTGSSPFEQSTGSYQFESESSLAGTRARGAAASGDGVRRLAQQHGQ